MWLAIAAVGSLGCGSKSANNNDGGPMVVCGDGVMEGDEQCDDGNTADGDGCDSECFIEGTCGDDVVEGREQCEGGDNCFPPGHADECEYIPASFRWNKFELTDPTFYAILFGGPGGACSPANGSLNGVLNSTVNGDSPPAPVTLPPKDGLIDLGFEINLFPLSQNDGATYEGTFQSVTCNGGEKPLDCAEVDGANVLEFSAMSSTTDDCLGVVPDSTTSDPGPQPVTAGSAACFVGGPESFTINLGTTIAIPLIDVRLAAEFDADPAENMVNGMVRGFLTEEAGQAAVIDEALGPPFGGFSLAQLLQPEAYGEEGACGGASYFPPPVADQDMLEDGTVGWWFYLKFEGEPTVWNGGELCGNGMIDENEACDRGIPAGSEGACELDCDDGLSCTIDTLNNGDPCNPKCWHHAFADEDDNCCPLEAVDPNSTAGVFKNDADCVAKCGNESLDPWEVCEFGDETNPCHDSNIELCDDEDECTTELGYRVSGGPLAVVQNFCVDCPDGACECRYQAVPNCP